MSFSTMYCIGQNGLAEPILDLSNGWGSAPVVWGALIEKYKVKLYPNDIPGKEYYRGLKEWEDLWEKADSLDLQWWEWNVLMWTYDWHIVRSEDFKCFADSLRRFQSELVSSTRVSHLTRIADEVEEILKTDTPLIGVCHWHTSASDDPWVVRENDDDERPYDINRDTQHTLFKCRTGT